MDEIIKKILSNIKFNEKDSILLDNIDSVIIPIEKNNFHVIKYKKSNKKIAFVDGGNSQILRAPSIALFFNRIYYTIYQNNKRIKSKIIEFYSLISTLSKDNNIFFKTDYFSNHKLNLKEYEFDSFDKTLISSNKRASISVIGSVIRRFAELDVINEISADIIILDGSLETNYTHEEEIINSLNNKDSIVCGLSKTTELLTGTGNSVGAYLLKLANEKVWYYDAGNNLFFVKLQPNSKYVFRLDTLEKANINEILSLLIDNSKDPIFFGYPYGLVEADRFARVNNKEAEILKLQLQAKLKKDFSKVEAYLNALNAHDILDNIS